MHGAKWGIPVQGGPAFPLLVYRNCEDGTGWAVVFNDVVGWVLDIL